VAVTLLSRRGFLPPLDEALPVSIAVTVIASGLSFAAAAVHNAAIGAHFADDPRIGAAFVAMAVFQAGWAVLYLALPTSAVAAIGLVVNDVIVIAWGWSRTVGLPIGSHAGGPEPIGFQDLVATLLEVLLIVVLAVRLAPQVRPLLARSIRFGDAVIATTFGILVIAVVAGLAVSGFVAGE
jgi:hypothetical protein